MIFVRLTSLPLLLLALNGCESGPVASADADTSCQASLGSHLCGAGQGQTESGVADPSLSGGGVGARGGSGH